MNSKSKLTVGCLLCLGTVIQHIQAELLIGTTKDGICKFSEKDNPNAVYGCLKQPEAAKGATIKPDVRTLIEHYYDDKNTEYLLRLACTANGATVEPNSKDATDRYAKNFNQLPTTKLGMVVQGNKECIDVPAGDDYAEVDRRNGICVFYLRGVPKHCMTAPATTSKEVHSAVVRKGWLNQVLACSATEAKTFSFDLESEKKPEDQFTTWFASKMGFTKKEKQPHGVLIDYKTCDFK